MERSNKMRTVDMAYIALAAVLMALCSWISLNLGPVPFTLQTFAVFLAIAVLGGKRGTLAVVVYLLMGAVGLPVFANFSGGIGALLGTTGGYILAIAVLGGKRGTLAVVVYLLMGAVGLPVFANFSGGIGALLGTTGGYILGFLGSALVMWAMEAAFGRKTWVLALSMVLGLLVCYAFGTAWFMQVYARTSGPVGLAAALGWCVIPYLVPDLVKIVLALLLSKRLAKAIQLR